MLLKTNFSIIIFILVSSVYAQSNKRLRAFTDDNKVFLEEINTFMLTGSASEETKKMMKKFSKMWKGNTFLRIKNLLSLIYQQNVERQKKTNSF